MMVTPDQVSEQQWQEIQWLTDLEEGIRRAKEENRPLLLFVSVLFHELCHSFVAQARGLAVKSITLFIFGGVSNIAQKMKQFDVWGKMVYYIPRFLELGRETSSLSVGGSVRVGPLHRASCCYGWVDLQACSVRAFSG